MPRAAKMFTYQGCTMTISEWAEVLEIDAAMLRGRLLRGWPMEKALAMPRQHQGTDTTWFDAQLREKRERVPGTLDQVPVRNWMTGL